MANELQPFKGEMVRSGQDSDRVLSQVQSNRQAAEVQAAMVIARQFPRSVVSAENRILDACKRPRMAEVALYSYPKGGTRVTGPSIRLAECMAQNWGNIDFGIIELEQRPGESVVMAFAWDLETNARQQKVFTVPHKMKSSNAQGGYRVLSDPRDIYEHVANQGARRLRACILGIIPGDLQESAIEQCERTLQGGSDMPLIDRVKLMVQAFSSLDVSRKELETYLQHPIDSIDESELVRLRGIYQSLKDGMASKENWFKPKDEEGDDEPKGLAPGTRKAGKPKAKKPEPIPEPMKEGDPNEHADEELPQEPAEEEMEEEDDEEQPTPEESREEARSFFDQDLKKNSAPGPDDPMSEEKVQAMKVLLNRRLHHCGLRVNSRNRNRLSTFAALGTGIDVADPTNADFDALKSKLETLTDDEISEALGS